MLTEPAFLLYVHSKARMNTPPTLWALACWKQKKSSPAHCSKWSPRTYVVLLPLPPLHYQVVRTLHHYSGNIHCNIKMLLDLSRPYSSAAALLSLTKGFQDCFRCSAIPFQVNPPFCPALAVRGYKAEWRRARQPSLFIQFSSNFQGKRREKEQWLGFICQTTQKHLAARS